MKMVHVYTKIERPKKELVDSYLKLAAATVYEASGRNGSVDPVIKPIGKGLKLLGTAVTVECRAKDNLMLHKAIQVAEPGDVIVANTDGYYDAGYMGDLMAGSARARGIAGIAIDGCVRDCEEIIDMGFPVFSRGLCMRGTIKNALGTVNHPIVFGGIIVNPGDLIIGDDDGIVVVPKSKIESVLEATLQRVEKEKQKAIDLGTGVPGVIINKLDVVFEKLGLIEE